jgi:hypothetical protein
MRVPGAAELLDIWERGLPQPLLRQMLALLSAAYPELSGDQLAALPIGRRDARLLELRERLFGPDLTAVASCPRCGEHLQSTFRVADIRLVGDATPETARAIDVEDYRITFRLPATSDLLALSAALEGASPRRALLDRCLIEVCASDGEEVDRDALPEHVVAAIGAQMSAADPQADVELHLSCPACAHAWRAMFDIVSFLSKEIHAWAQRTLREVHALARAYGWREADALALSATRRQIYLELAGQ